MDHVVGGARVHRILLKHRLGHGGRLHVDGEVAPVMRRPEQRERVEGARVLVFGVLLGQPPHGVPIPEIPLLLGALAVEHLHRLQPVPLAPGGHAGKPVAGGRREGGEHGQGRLPVLLHPDRMVEGLRFAPVRHREIRIDLARCPEAGRGILVFEVVQEQEPGFEVRLSLGGPRRGELHGSEFLRACRSRGEEREQGTENQDGLPGNRPGRSVHLTDSFDGLRIWLRLMSATSARGARAVVCAGLVDSAGGLRFLTLAMDAAGAGQPAESPMLDVSLRCFP